jgi:hypothetical protein
VGDYVPYEERIRKEREAEAAAATAAAKAHLAALETVTALVRRLDGDRTDHYLEILLPLGRGIRRHFDKRTRVTQHGLAGGPNFVISEVLSAYRIPAGIVPPPTKEGDLYPFDAHLVSDGRVWRHRGVGVTPNTYQLLDSSAHQLSSLSTGDLERIAADLLGRLRQGDS